MPVNGGQCADEAGFGPVKVAAMTQAGLEIVEDKRVIGRPTAHNVSYLASKRDRAGHIIDVEALAAQAPIDG